MGFDRLQCHKDLRINENDLQSEWLKQAQLFFDYASQMSILSKKRNELSAKLADDIKTNPEKFGIPAGKVSEAALERSIQSNIEIIELNYQIDLYSNAVKAFEHKKRALEYECQLLMGGFFAEPKEKPINPEPRRKRRI